MATPTTNLSLIKAAVGDKYSLDTTNANLDTIDAAVFSNSSDTVMSPAKPPAKRAKRFTGTITVTKGSGGVVGGTKATDDNGFGTIFYANHTEIPKFERIVSVMLQSATGSSAFPLNFNVSNFSKSEADAFVVRFYAYQQSGAVAPGYGSITMLLIIEGW